MIDLIKPVWRYRYFILTSVRNELITKFSRSRLGAVWIIINPLSMVLIYAFILSNIMTSKLPGVESQYSYPIYIISGIIPWTLFSEIYSRSLNIFIDNANIIKKINFPKLTLPFIAMGSAWLNFIMLLLLSYIVFAILGHLPYEYILYIPILTVLTSILALSLGVFFGIINVFLRDVGQIMVVILQFWFWLTPIVYTKTIIPEKFHWLIDANPLTSIVESYQAILVYDKAPEIRLLIYPTIICVIFLILTVKIYNRANKEMGDVL